MAEVKWTPQAADDLESIAERIARDSPHYASLFVMDVLAAVERLILFPELGRMVPETGVPAIREIILGNYRVIYRHSGEAVEIFAIYHGAKLVDPSRFS